MSKIERVYLRGDFGLTGLYCKAHDVDQLEAINAELLERAEAVVTRWDSPAWKDQPHTGVFIDQLRAAIAKAKGEMP